MRRTARVKTLLVASALLVAAVCAVPRQAVAPPAEREDEKRRPKVGGGHVIEVPGG
jgi:hypothetical protein